MREFKNRPLITTVSWETRLLYTLFLLFCAANYLLMGVIASLRAGWFGEGVRNYFAGTPTGAVDEILPKTFNELADLTHFHLFSVPVFLLIQCHIFLLCAFPKKGKAIVCAASFVAALVYTATPWLVRYLPGADFTAWLFGPARLVLFFTLVIMLVVPLQQMWSSKRFKFED